MHHELAVNLQARVQGRWPGLDSAHLYKNRNIAVTTDFRDVFAEVLAKRMGVQSLERPVERRLARPPAALGERLHRRWKSQVAAAPGSAPQVLPDQIPAA